MGILLRVVRALPMTFVVYVLTTLVASAVAFPTTLELERALTHRPPVHSAGFVIETAIGLVPMLRAQATTLMFVVLAQLVLSPWLQMSWLYALTTPKSLGATLVDGSVRYGRALRVSIAVGLGTLFGGAVLTLPAWGAHVLLRQHANARVHDLAVLGLGLVPLAWVLWSFCWHDLARAHARERGTARAALASMAQAARPRVYVVYLFYGGVGHAAVAAACAVAASLALTTSGVGLWVLGLTQAGVFLRFVARSFWLAEAALLSDAVPAGKRVSRPS